MARALAANPPVLLMDEPFGALDPITRIELQRVFQRIQRDLRQTVLLVTHDIAEACSLGTRVGVLDARRADRLRHASGGRADNGSARPRSCSTRHPRCRGLPDMTGIVSFWLAHGAELWGMFERHVAARRALDRCCRGTRRARRASSPRIARDIGRPIVWLANVAQTIPSMALLGFLLPLPLVGGVGWRVAVVALILYALLPIVRGTLAGLKSVDPSVVAAGTAMGMTARQLLWIVELPLALPSIVAGIRVATVSASAPRLWQRRSARAGSASTSSVGCRWSIRPSSCPAPSRPPVSRSARICSLTWAERSLRPSRRARQAAPCDRRWRRSLVVTLLCVAGAALRSERRHGRRRIEELHRAGHPGRDVRADARA